MVRFNKTYAFVQILGKKPLGPEIQQVLHKLLNLTLNDDFIWKAIKLFFTMFQGDSFL